MREAGVYRCGHLDGLSIKYKVLLVCIAPITDKNRDLGTVHLFTIALRLITHIAIRFMNSVTQNSFFCLSFCNMLCTICIIFDGVELLVVQLDEGRFTC